MRTCHSKLRYFDWHGQGGRVLATFQEARAVAYADDGYIKAILSVTLQVPGELKAVLKTDAGLDLNVSKTSILPISRRFLLT